MKTHDSRTSIRMPKYLGAKIEFNDSQSLIDCIVRNQSPDGALISIETPVDLPRVFDLHVAKSDQRFRCALVWNGANRAGVRFCSVQGEWRRPHLRPVS